MMHPEIRNQDQRFSLATAVSYIFLCRTYYPQGSDTAAVWLDTAGNCHHYAEAGGGGSAFPSQPEKALIVSPQIVFSGRIPKEKFDSIMSRSLVLGALSFPHEISSLSSSHVINSCMIRSPAGEENHFRVASGPCAIEQANEVVDLVTDISLDDFYWKMRNGDRERLPMKWI